MSISSKASMAGLRHYMLLLQISLVSQHADGHYFSHGRHEDMPWPTGDIFSHSLWLQMTAFWDMILSPHFDIHAVMLLSYFNTFHFRHLVNIYDIVYTQHISTRRQPARIRFCHVCIRQNIEKYASVPHTTITVIADKTLQITTAFSFWARKF